VNHRIRLLIVARDAPHRQVMRAWLAGATGITVVGEAQGEPEALTLTGERQPDVVLLGVDPLGLDDLETVARFQLMEAATQNAERLIDELTLVVQTACQQAITQEMQELAAGAGLLGPR
jgi:chemotaxis response regulator CheB